MPFEIVGPNRIVFDGVLRTGAGRCACGQCRGEHDGCAGQRAHGGRQPIGAVGSTPAANGVRCAVRRARWSMAPPSDVPTVACCMSACARARPPTPLASCQAELARHVVRRADISAPQLRGTACRRRRAFVRRRVRRVKVLRGARLSRRSAMAPTGQARSSCAEARRADLPAAYTAACIRHRSMLAG